MRKCTKCQHEKPLSEFRFANKAKGLYQSQCKQCCKEQEKAYWDANEERRKNHIVHTQQRRHRNKDYMDDYLRSHICDHCGESNFDVLDFVSKDPDNKTLIRETFQTSSIERFQEEIHNCLVLCANCAIKFKGFNNCREYKFIDTKRDHDLAIVTAMFDDIKNRDKKKGLDTDIDKQFINDTLFQPCTYCGENDITKTLDRIDNNIGHTKDNLVPCCIRCNLVRRNMPIEAWTELAKGMREARELGLFGDWTGPKIGNSKKGTDESN